MRRNPLESVLFLLGLLVLSWIGLGYVGTSTPALAVVLLIAACYVAGGLELLRYRQATAALADALARADTPVDDLRGWLAGVADALRPSVRQRIEGDRVALPAPALTPYLVGLLVLLGMLGTLLGMMTTLRGTGAALQGAADLDTVRASLAAPVTGLAFAFGTSIAGVAASALLGLLSALSRRDRAAAVQALDAAIATTLRAHSRSHQREEAFRLLQRQVETMPALVEHLQAAMAGIEKQGIEMHERQLAQQAAFHERTEAVHVALAASVQRSLEQGVADGARAAGAVLQPAIDATMQALAQQAASLHERVGDALQRQVDAQARQMAASTTAIAGLWTQALSEQQASNAALTQDLQASLGRFATTLEATSTELVASLATRFDATSERATAAWRDALAQQEALGEAASRRQQDALGATTATLDALTASLLAGVRTSNTELQAALQAQAQASARLLDGAAARLEAASTQAAGAWTTTLARQDASSLALAERQQQVFDTTAATFEAHGRSLVDAVQQAHAELVERLDAQTRGHARETLDEIARLVRDAAEAPKAAAAAIAELRQGLTESLARDNAMLEERARLLATVDTLLGTVNLASAEQRAAVDTLIATSADALDRVATRFSGQVDAQAARLDAAADRIAAGGIEAASLGDVFASALAGFGTTNAQLVERLQAVETVLGESLARSDEQLAYYVAQAREVVDLSVLAQKQIIGELQQLARRQASGAALA